ncbi:MAG: hypothetical protein JW910_19045, partial [Anaerolineae bacterium]|nr:hypothetical protein [Anaerolineae bacterium]
FTLVEDEAVRAGLLSSLARAVTDPQSRLRVVITLRGDFYDRPLHYAGFNDLIRDATEVVLPLSPPELVQAITGPAQRLGMFVEEDLIASIVTDVNEQPASLPLLQYALTELFEQREDRWLTQAAYQASGGVLGALARRAEDVYAGQSPAAQAVTRQLFLRLVAMHETQEGSRRRVRWSELTPIAGAEVLQPVLDLFGKHRLLTFDRDLNTREPTVEVAHEALLHEWGRLRRWLDDSREDLLTYRRLAEAVAEWQRAGRDPSFLVSGTRLAQFETLAAGEFSLSQEERLYIRACVALRQRSARRLRLFIATLIVLLVAALVLAGLSIDRENRALAARDDANEQASLARSRELAALALSNETQLDLALLLSLESLYAADSFEARNSLLTLLQAQPQLLHMLHHGAAVRAIAYRPDGPLLAAGGADHAITLWNTITGQQVGAPLTEHSDVVNSVAFSPHGALLASASHDQTVRLWTLTEDGDAQAGHTLAGHDDAVWSVAFSPDGALLASASADDTVRLWDVASGQPHGEPLVGHTDDVFSVAFSPDGILLASAGADSVARLWDVTTGEQVAVLSGAHTNWIMALAFSPDGQLLVTASYDTTLQLWSVQTREPVGQPLTGHTDWVRSVAFSADGTRLVSSGRDGRVMIWDMTSWPPQPLLTLSGQRDRVWSVRFSPDGRQVASASLDGTVWLWEPGANSLVGRGIAAHDDAVVRAVFSPDGRFLASASSGDVEDAPLRLWDGASGAALDSAAALPASITDLDFSLDGQTLAVADAGGSLFLWSVTEAGELLPGTILANPAAGARDVVFDLAWSGAVGRWLAAAQDRGRVALWDMAADVLVAELTSDDLTGNVFSVAFSPDGRLLAAAGESQVIVVWDTETRQPAGGAWAG